MALIVLGCVFGTFAIGVSLGVFFAFSAAEESKAHSRTVLVSIISAYIGCLIAAFIPMLEEYRLFGVLGFAFISAIVGSNTYWMAVKRHSGLTRHLYHEWPQGHSDHNDMPSTPPNRMKDTLSHS